VNVSISSVQTVFDVAFKQRESHDEYYRSMYQDDLERLRTYGLAGLEGGAGDAAADQDGSWSGKVYDHIFESLNQIFSSGSPARQRHMLELGAGTGQLSCRMAGPDVRVCLVDHEPVAAAVAAKIAELEGKTDFVDVRCTDLFSVGERECYDTVFSIGVFEELNSDERAEYLRLATRLLKPGGMCLIAVPNFASPIMVKLWRRHGKASEVFLSQRGLRQLLRKAGFDQVRSTAIGSVTPTQKVTFRDRMLSPWLGMLNVGWGIRRA
jgi:2-polyprenyl-3-methyl-5-hydroxy-6-metoxy-1,4-benzoquinol methylase